MKFNFAKSSILLPLILVGCVTTRPTVKPTDNLPMENSYVAGEFLLSHSEWAPRMAVALRKHGAEKEIYIELKKEANFEGITLVSFEPGKYELIDVIKFSGSGDGIMERVPFKDLTHSRFFNLSPGDIVYIGSFDGQSYHQLGSLILTPYYISASTSGSAAFSYQYKDMEWVTSTLHSKYPGIKTFSLHHLEKLP